MARQRPTRCRVKPWEWRLSGKRWRRHKPATRWEDELEDFTATQLGANPKDWRMLAAFKEEWKKAEGRLAKEDEEEDE